MMTETDIQAIEDNVEWWKKMVESMGSNPFDVFVRPTKIRLNAKLKVCFDRETILRFKKIRRQILNRVYARICRDKSHGKFPLTTKEQHLKSIFPRVEGHVWKHPARSQSKRRRTAPVPIYTPQVPIKTSKDVFLFDVDTHAVPYHREFLEFLA